MAALVLPTEDRLFTYADYKRWELAEGERYELIDGVAYAMAAPNAIHQAIVAVLTAKLYNFFEDKPGKVYPAPYDVRLFYEEDESDDTVVQPDISVVCDEKKRGAEGCRGAPDLAVEIVSPTNTFVEMARKFERYRQAGVREYWVVNPEPQTLFVYRFDGGEIITRSYRPPGNVRSETFPHLEIPLEPVFAG
ncbi:MAG: Uma2 family endonuclease [Treponema sp.]|nr:Uma2 family endonuclease [Treponema sp.]